MPVQPRLKKSFRDRMLEPQHRRSTHIEDLSGPNIESPVPLVGYPDSLWYDPFDLPPGKAEHDFLTAQAAVIPQPSQVDPLVRRRKPRM